MRKRRILFILLFLVTFYGSSSPPLCQLIYVTVCIWKLSIWIRYAVASSNQVILEQVYGLQRPYKDMDRK
jgi:hypothetical protein